MATRLATPSETKPVGKLNPRWTKPPVQMTRKTHRQDFIVHFGNSSSTIELSFGYVSLSALAQISANMKHFLKKATEKVRSSLGFFLSTPRRASKYSSNGQPRVNKGF
jgi:hypothetical protein